MGPVNIVITRLEFSRTEETFTIDAFNDVEFVAFGFSNTSFKCAMDDLLANIGEKMETR